MSDRPAYFTRLAPWREAFRQGGAILTYHKFGRHPRGARLKGLHLPARLFRRQLRDIVEAGWGSGAVDVVAGQAGAGGVPAVALTIDDGFRSVFEIALPLLKEFEATATLYLVADRLGGRNDWEIEQGEVPAPLMNEAEVREWLAAGQRMGSHTLTHPWLTRIPLAQAREEIRASKARLEDRFGVAVTDFCYPYGDWNPAVRDEVREAGYRTATTTDVGVNAPGQDRYALRRVTARRASWGWRAVRRWWGSLRSLAAR